MPLCWSDGGFEFVESGGQPEQVRRVDREFVVAAAQVWMDACPRITTLAVRFFFIQGSREERTRRPDVPTVRHIHVDDLAMLATAR